MCELARSSGGRFPQDKTDAFSPVSFLPPFTVNIQLITTIVDTSLNKLHHNVQQHDVSQTKKPSGKRDNLPEAFNLVVK